MRDRTQALDTLLRTNFVKYGKINKPNTSEFPTFQQDNCSNNQWKSFVLNVASLGKITHL